MEKWRERVSKSPQCRYDHPSFSSTLLDSIYRSIDDEHRAGGNSATNPRTHPTRFIPPEITRPSREHRARINHPRSAKHPTAATSSSSSGSSYSGFSSSSSEPASTRFPPVRTGPDGEKRSKKERLGSIRTRFLRELRKGRDPVSPAARLANFLNSLFAVKSKTSRGAVTVIDDSACSSASSYSRSCMSKASSLRGKSAEKRSVRFYPISVIVDEDCRPCGHKCVYGEERPVAVARGRRGGAMFGELGAGEEEEEEEDGDVWSDSSSDLFELESLAVAGRFQDELPVYETTRFNGYFA